MALSARSDAVVEERARSDRGDYSIIVPDSGHRTDIVRRSNGMPKRFTRATRNIPSARRDCRIDCSTGSLVPTYTSMPSIRRSVEKSGNDLRCLVRLFVLVDGGNSFAIVRSSIKRNKKKKKKKNKKKEKRKRKKWKKRKKKVRCNVFDGKYGAFAFFS